MTYLLTKCITESCDSPVWLIQYCLSIASSRVTETVSMKMPCGECFQKCFSAYDQSMAEYRNTYHCYDLATQND